jgi:hypothetical protein
VGLPRLDAPMTDGRQADVRREHTRSAAASVHGSRERPARHGLPRSRLRAGGTDGNERLTTDTGILLPRKGSAPTAPASAGAVVVLSTVVVFASGVLLLLLGPGSRGSLSPTLALAAGLALALIPRFGAWLHPHGALPGH